MKNLALIISLVSSLLLLISLLIVTSYKTNIVVDKEIVYAATQEAIENQISKNPEKYFGPNQLHNRIDEFAKGSNIKLLKKLVQDYYYYYENYVKYSNTGFHASARIDLQNAGRCKEAIKELIKNLSAEEKNKLKFLTKLSYN